MRVTGVLLALGSIFFLLRDIGLGVTDDWFFGIATGLGLLTFAASFWPHRHGTTDEQPLLRRSMPRKRSTQPALSAAPVRSTA